ncbi:hypothetical protein Rumeso_00920 [Rubellimicrobium mesophilum DSM 19309]|uniref:Uncharacterized protein n=1 Tax=Rubellimicrobium mesophilum DSM 19309 TaxID=442562 RepID=A0A017HT47_9RHOB|nr:hypothetical protein Rumeso_00920 [Rubellimicrobium mesophilum DSM 19309]
MKVYLASMTKMTLTSTPQRWLQRLRRLQAEGARQALIPANA